MSTDLRVGEEQGVNKIDFDFTVGDDFIGNKNVVVFNFISGLFNEPDRILKQLTQY